MDVDKYARVFSLAFSHPTNMLKRQRFCFNDPESCTMYDVTVCGENIIIKIIVLL